MIFGMYIARRAAFGYEIPQWLRNIAMECMTEFISISRFFVEE
jgi:hypothetical protein